MTLRAKIIGYLVGLHVVIGAAAVVLLIEQTSLLFAVEALFLLSIVLSVRLVRALFVPLDLIRTGAELIAERDFTSRFVPVGQPELDTLIGVYNEMIDRLRDERLAAEERHQLLEKIVEASPAGIVICDFDGRVERVNPAARRLQYDAVIATDESRTESTRTHGESAGPETSTWIAHVGARRLKVSRASFRDRGFVKRFYVIEEMTEELRLSEKAAYEKLIRIMSHEVNNSVGAVRSLLESSLRYAPQIGDSDRDDYTNALTIASARIDALNRFMSAFADVVRIPPPHRVPTSVADLIERVVSVLRPELDDRGITIDLELADRGDYDVDPAQIEQVILNILRNAIDAIGRDGRITVTFIDGTVRVRDTGPGIPDDVRSQLFTPFFTTKRDGRGLGLTVVHEILANHEAAFSLSNAEEGGGEFVIEW